jgi:hypothetical protein
VNQLTSARYPVSRPGPAQCCPQFLFESRRDGMPAARQRPDDYPILGVQFIDHRARHMAKPTGHPVPLYRAANGFRDHQTDAGPVARSVIRRPHCVHHEIGLHRPHPLTDRGTEFRGPRHPVPRRKHRAKSRVESRSQLAATLAAPVRHDRSACPGAHPQPKPMHPRPTTVVGLKGPLALGHGCSLLVAFGIRKPTPTNPHAGGDAIAVGKLVRLANRRGLQTILGRSRIATCGRLFEGTDENSLGQTLPDGAP